ncbi:MAG: sensor histidine kinase, partial [Methyloligellaceae bacterium]
MVVLKRTRDKLALGAGALSALTGLVVLYGWYSQNYAIVQIHHSFVAMQYNTASGFLLCGTGLVLLTLRYERGAAALGALAASIGIITLFQYISGIDVGLDELFMKHEVTTRTSHPGRMAPNTALCFTLVGMALIAGSILRRYEKRDQFVRLLGGLAFILGGIAFCGYLGGFETAYGWAHLTRMAVHTSFAFMVLGGGLIANSWFDRGVTLDNASIYWLSGALVCFILIMAFNLSSEIRNNEEEALKRSIRTEAELLTDQIRKSMNSDIRALARMNSRQTLTENITEQAWRADAAGYISDIPGLVILARLNKKKEILWLESASGDPALEKMKFPLHKQILMAQARQSSRSFEVAVSKYAAEFNLFFPVDINWQSDGFIFARFDVRQKLKGIFPKDTLDLYGLKISSGEQTLFRSGLKPEGLLSHSVVVNFHGTRLLIEVWPQKKLLTLTQSGLANSPIIGGIFIAFLLSIAISFAIKSLIMARSVRESEKQTQAIVDNVVEGIVTINEAGKIETFNKACERIFGYKSEEVIGQNVKILMPVNYATEHDGYISAFSKTGRKKIIGIGREVEGLTREGRIFPMDLSIGEISTGNRVAFTGIVRDISERKKFEDDQARLIDMLAKSNAELDDFAYIASHDMKEPLRAIYNHSCFLLEDYEDKLDEDGVKKLNRLITLSKRMEKLTNDLLYFSRLGREELAYKDTNMNDVIKDIKDMLLDTLAEKNAVIEINEHLPTVMCDGVRVTELFRNLIVNGIKYNSREDKKIEVGYRTDDNSFFVRDNGIGISKEFHNDVFRIFKRLN